MIKYLPTEEIERRAVEILNEADVMYKPVPVNIITQHLGIKIEYASLGDDVSGFLFIENDEATIGVNETHSLVRQRFTVAHECGHYLLHARRSGLFIDKKYIAARDSVSSSGEDRAEIQANQFAAALLMPQPLIEAEINSRALDLGDNNDALETLAQEFQVSVQAMAYRLSNLGIL